MEMYESQRLEGKNEYYKRVLEISVESEIFSGMLKDLNEEVQNCIRNVYDEKFEAGEITLKLSIELPESHENFPIVDKNGEVTIETVKYRKPVFSHKVTTTLKKQFKRDGGYSDKRDIQFRDGKFIAIPIKELQIEIGEI